MINFYKSSAALLLLLPISLSSLAAESKAAPESMPGMAMPQGKGMGMGMGMGMMGGMSEEQLDQHLRNQQEHLLMMHDLSNQILNEKDPAKKEQLKKQQLELMKAHHAQKMEHRQDMKDKRRQMMPPKTK